MALEHEQDSASDFADSVDSALESLWGGDSEPLERLLESDGAAGPPVGELLKGAIAEHGKPIIGLPGGAEIPGYEIVGEIGRGGMGVVYKARQLSTKRIVALKVMLAGPFASQTGRRRFQREVELTARFQHAGIVRVLEGGEASTGQPYYAMDYVEGVPLDQWLSSLKPDVHATLCLFRELCDVVDYAHGRGVVHRDLKPGNVLIDGDRKPHILDFGLAKAAEGDDSQEPLTTSVSSPGLVIGTLRYLSPEQAAGTPQQIDARTDAYALGVMLFEALTGTGPFDSEGPASDVAQRILEKAPTAPSSVCDRVDSELEIIILKALEKDPSRRYQSVREMGEDLGRYLAGEPILARRSSRVYVLRKRLAKHRIGVRLAGAGLVVALCALLAVMWRGRQELARARHSLMLHQCDLEQGDLDESLRAVSRIFERYPDLPEARLVWSQTQFRMGWQRGDEHWSGRAVKTLKDGLHQHPSKWAYQALLAEIYRRVEDPGWQELRVQADRDVPDTAEACYLRSFTTLDLQRAVSFAREALTRDRNHELARERLAYLYLQTEDFDGALRMAQEALDRGGNRRVWTLFQGNVLIRQGRYEQAVERYSELVSLSPTSLLPYWSRAHAQLCGGEYYKAIEDYSTSLQVDAGDPSPYWHRYYRATALWITGQRDKAAEDYRRFRSLRGRISYADARLFLLLNEQSRILHSQGRLDDAKQTRAEAYDVLQAARRGASPGGWLGKILDCLAGELSPDELVAAADATNVEYVCESYYYAGEVCLLNGSIDRARNWFQACVDTGLVLDPTTAPTPMNEYHLALWRIRSLVPGGPDWHGALKTGHVGALENRPS